MTRFEYQDDRGRALGGEVGAASGRIIVEIPPARCRLTPAAAREFAGALVQMADEAEIASRKTLNARVSS